MEVPTATHSKAISSKALSSKASPPRAPCGAKKVLEKVREKRVIATMMLVG